MNREQNIDDILKLLKDSVNSEGIPDNSEHIADAAPNISTESLQRQLKDQYVSSAASIETDGTDSEYVIDSDFLSAAIEHHTDNAPVTVIEDEPRQIIVEEPIKEQDEVLENEIFDNEEIIEDVIGSEEDVSSEFDAIEMPPIFEKSFDAQEIEADESEESSVDEPEIVMHPLFMSEYTSTAPKITEATAEKKEYIPSEGIIEEAACFEKEDSVTSQEFSTDEEPTVEKTKAHQEPYETFLASMRKAGVDFTLDDIDNSLPKEENASYLENAEDDEILESALDVEDLDYSTFDLMMQLGAQDEIEKTVAAHKSASFAKSEQSETAETENSHLNNKRNQKNIIDASRVMSSLRAQRTQTMLSAITCAALTLVALIYDLCPIFDISLSGMFDYNDYPAVYVLIGLQLLVLCVVARYKSCWQGLKSAFSSTPTRDSFAIIVALLTAVYDLIVMLILAFSRDDVPNLYNASAILLLFLCALMDDLELCAKMKAFDVYSLDTDKYTFVKQGATGNVARKMYVGGLEHDRAVYVTEEATEDRSFYSELFKKNTSNKALSFIIIPLLSLGMLSSLIAIIFGADAYFACAAFIVCVYLLLPTILVLCHEGVSFIIAQRRLTGRGSALTGIGAIDNYADMDIAVFNDLHMFKKCNTEDIGIVVYDTKVGYLVLGCIDALYAKLGGPMSDMKMNLPDVFRFNNVYIRRASRNGVEALIEKKYNIIVGEPEFMQRYGLMFPSDESDNGRSTLCVSLDGKITAKLSVKYKTEPAFEMLIERLASVGIACAIQTLDPLISSALIARSRTLGVSPVSVVHKSADDTRELKKNVQDGTNMLISSASRIKLVEAVVWLKKLSKLKKICRIVSGGLSATGMITVILLLIFGGITYINQAVIWGYMLLQTVGMCVLYISMLPNKQYFTVEKLYSELEREHTKQLERERKINENKEEAKTNE